MHFVYIIYSHKLNGFYIGYTTISPIHKRLMRHNGIYRSLLRSFYTNGCESAINREASTRLARLYITCDHLIKTSSLITHFPIAIGIGSAPGGPTGSKAHRYGEFLFFNPFSQLLGNRHQAP